MSAGQTYTLELGYVRSAEGEPAAGEATPAAGEASDTPTPEPTPETTTSKISSTLMTIVWIGGVVVLLLAVGVGVLFFLSRRGV